VTSLKKDIFYGNIVVEVNGEYLDIDSRPSDALALAVRTNVPVLVSREVMEENGIIPEEDMEEGEELGGAEPPALEGQSEDQEDRLSVFDDFLEKLDFEQDDDDDDED
jgi:hypothetical protein